MLEREAVDGAVAEPAGDAELERPFTTTLVPADETVGEPLAAAGCAGSCDGRVPDGWLVTGCFFADILDGNSFTEVMIARSLVSVLLAALFP